MKENYVALVTYANQSCGPVPSGLMLEGLPHLAGRLLRDGFMPRIFDFNSTRSVKRISEVSKETFEKECADEIIEFVHKNDVKVIGFTLYSNGFSGSVNIASYVSKKCPETLIIAGGPLVNWVEGTIYQYTDVFDALCIGEGDLTMTRFAEHIYKRTPVTCVPNLLFSDGRRTETVFTDISTLPFPIYDEEVYPDVEYKIQVPVVRGSVGCWYGKCSYCIQPKIDGLFRKRKVENTFEEIMHNKNKYGFSHFRLSDPNPFFSELNQLVKLIPEEIYFSSFNYSTSLSDFETIKKKLIGLFIGVESFKPDVLLQLNKTKKPEEYIRDSKIIIQKAKEFGIPSIIAIIAPVPNDTIERLNYEYETIKGLNPDFVVGLPFGPLPGTPAYNEARRIGVDSGIRLNDNFEYDLMNWELDLLQPPSSWTPPPWDIKVEGKFTGNPFMVNHQYFLGRLKSDGFEPVADEIVMMAKLFYGKLPSGQEERRVKIIDFNRQIRQAIATSNSRKLEEIVSAINQNQQSLPS